MMETQVEFEFLTLDSPCRTCAYWWREYGVRGERQGQESKWWYGCFVSGFRMTSHIAQLPSECRTWKNGGEKMGFVDFSKMKEEDLRRELERIRGERRGVGRSKRVASRERRISGGKRETEQKGFIEL